MTDMNSIRDQAYPLLAMVFAKAYEDTCRVFDVPKNVNTAKAMLAVTIGAQEICDEHAKEVYDRLLPLVLGQLDDIAEDDG